MSAALVLAMLLAVPAPEPAAALRPAASTGAAAAPVSLAIVPAVLRLDHDGDRPRVVVVATLANGTTRDVTAEAELAVADGAIARVEPGPRLAAGATGRTELRARWSGLEARTGIQAMHQPEPEPSFRRDVVPVLTRQGCNAGGCHGAALGKNGFRLSLFGFDPARDHLRLTREMRARRIDLVQPESSLLLRKPTVQVSHKGGQRLEAGTPAYDTLRRWIAAGAPPPDPAEQPTIAIEISPAEIVFGAEGGRQRLVVRAIAADGSDRDVTALALLSSTDDSVARVEDGSVVAGARGEAFVLARFGTQAVVSQVFVVPPRASAPAAPAALPEPMNDIDRQLFAKMARLGLAPAPRCDDETFIRRATLDITSLLPAPEETAAFLADSAPDKRERLVDALLERPAAADVWSLQWAEVLRFESQQLKEKGMHHATEWLKRAFREHRPIDRIVYDMLVASGPAFDTPAVNLWLVEENPRGIAENVSQTFLGIRIQCAQCHNHPFERWTMDDYYGFVSFFTQIARKTGDDPRERVIFDRGSGEVPNPRDDRVLPPRFLGGEAPKIAPGEDRRVVFAKWLTAPENPWFAAHVANRVFARFFGRGLVEPPDDVRISNPPSHPELHRLLGRRLVADGFDIRPLIREICRSASYQQELREDGSPPAGFAGARLRRLGAEPLLDAVARVTGIAASLPGVAAGGRATEIEDGPVGAFPFLEIFGRPRRMTSAICERRSDPTLGQSLHLINGATLEPRIKDKNGWLHRRITTGAADADIVEELYLAAYSRRPTAGEKAERLADIATAKERAAALEDLVWAVLNSKEFLFQH